VKAAIIGGGVMGEAILAGALAEGVLNRADVTVCEKVSARAEYVRSTHGVAVTSDANEAMAGADLVVLCVKPQDLGTVKGSVPGSALILSIMAGVTCATIQTAFGHDRIVRAMPNTPAAIRAGVSAWYAMPAVSAEQRETARTLLSAVGKELTVDSEAKLDMVTAVSGSGPAYVFLFIEAMVEGAVAVGLTRAQAEELVLQNLYGSARYAIESGRTAADLRAQVTSPAGTTAAGLLELEKGSFRATVIECIRAAYRRAQELGKQA
jgi:pyrroline-5-carboxylate reductase